MSLVFSEKLFLNNNLKICWLKETPICEKSAFASYKC